jgi:23S rRNA (uridine2552-2'-O)-methyltransferase
MPYSKQKNIKTRVRTAKGRKVSSTAWLKRHINDPYVMMAKEQNYRSRAAFKLLEMNEKFGLFKSANSVVDLGAAPGGWCQAVKRSGSVGKVIAIDLQEMEPIQGVDIVHGNFLDEESQNQLESLMNGKKVDLVISDMAANSCGDRKTDHLRLMNLVEAAIIFSNRNLAESGNFVAKMLRGECEAELISHLRLTFHKVRLFKPKTSYQDSSEIYVVALGFKPQP